MVARGTRRDPLYSRDVHPAVAASSLARQAGRALRQLGSASARRRPGRVAPNAEVDPTVGKSDSARQPQEVAAAHLLTGILSTVSQDPERVALEPV